MIEQIAVWVSSSSTEPSGVLNFRVEDIAYFYTPAGSRHSELLIRGGAIYYTVLYNDLKQIIDKETKVK